MPTLALSWGDQAYTDSGGKGRPFVFLHGSGCDSYDWSNVIAALPPSLRVICMDFRGHGASGGPGRGFTVDGLADDSLALAERLDLRNAVLVGHSLGGIVAMAAAKRSDRITGLILLEGWTNRRAERSFSGDRLHAGLEKPAMAVIQKKLDDTLRRTGAAWKELSDSCTAFDGFPYLQSARIPILEVYGEAGRTPDTESKLEIPPNPCIQMAWIPEAGHYLPHARPRAVADLCAMHGHHDGLRGKPRSH